MNTNDVFKGLDLQPTDAGAPSAAPTVQPSPTVRDREGYWKPTDMPVSTDHASGLPEQHPSNKRILFFVIGIVVAGLLGGGYFAYSKGYISIPGLSPKSDELFDKMVDSLSDIKNAQYSVRLTVKGEPRDTKYTPIFKPSNRNANLSLLNPFRQNGAVAGVTTDSGSGEVVAQANTNVNAAVNGDTPGEAGSGSAGNTNASNTNSFAIENVGSEVGLGQASNPLLGLGDMYGVADYYSSFFQYIPSDINLTGGISLYFESDKKPSESDGSFRIDGSYTGSDISAAVDLEARKKDQDIYGVINKFPNLFIDTTAIKGKWVKLNSDDTEWYDPKNLDSVDTQEIVDTLKRLLKHALKEKLYTVKQKLPAEMIAGVKSEHYLINFDPTKIVAVYDAFINEERAKNGKRINEYEKLRKSVSDPEFLALQQRIADNSRVEVWIDKVNGYLRQIKSDIVVVPPENIEKLKGRQFVASTTLTMEKVNQKVSIDKPNDPIGIDEATRLLTGITKEDQQADKQMNRVRDLQTMLNAYQKKVGSYPDTLDLLTPKIREFNQQCIADTAARKANKNTNTAYDSSSYDYNCYSYTQYEKKPVNITDAYTNKPYAYVKEGADFKVTYQLTLGDSERVSYYKESYANGTNTMTSKDLSLEKENSSEKYAREHPVNTNSNTNSTSSTTDTDGDNLSDLSEKTYNTDATKKDTDNDTLSDYDEIYSYNTKPLIKDTDSDGFDDGTEVQGGYNPNGAGLASDAQLLQWGKPTSTNDPKIENMNISSSNGKAHVTWTTNFPTKGEIAYKDMSSTGNSTIVGESAATTTHSMEFPVAPGATYSYAVSACNDAVQKECISSPTLTYTAP